VNGVITRYVYDGPSIAAEYDGDWNLVTKYLPSLGIDDPLAMEQATGSYFYHKKQAVLLLSSCLTPEFFFLILSLPKSQLLSISHLHEKTGGRSQPGDVRARSFFLLGWLWK
jgi:hypothetical protein